MLAHFERCSGLGRTRVTAIQRVQNLRLWTKFQLRRHEIVELAGAQNPDSGPWSRNLTLISDPSP